MVDFACPKCKTKLESIKIDSLICKKCESKFPIKDGIPILLIDSKTYNLLYISTNLLFTLYHNYLRILKCHLLPGRPRFGLQ